MVPIHKAPRTIKTSKEGVRKMKSKGFSRAELSIATESFIRQELERKRLIKFGTERSQHRLAGEVTSLERILGFMIRNSK